MGGTASPSAFAVFKLMTISKVVGWITGRSAGFLAPFHRADPRPKDHGEYSRSGPCIAAKAATQCQLMGHSGRNRRLRERANGNAHQCEASAAYHEHVTSRPHPGIEKIDRIHEPGCGGSKYWPSMTAKSNMPPLKNMSSPISRTDSHDIHRLGDIKLQWEKIDYHKSCAFI